MTVFIIILFVRNKLRVKFFFLFVINTRSSNFNLYENKENLDLTVQYNP